eukprot:8673221-Alexandrium_andersonii.AAC.1
MGRRCKEGCVHACIPTRNCGLVIRKLLTQCACFTTKTATASENPWVCIYSIEDHQASAAAEEHSTAIAARQS